MSENEDIIRRGFDAFETADMAVFTADWADDVVWDVAHYEGWPGDRTSYQGAADILGAFGQFLAQMRVQRIDMHEITEYAPDRVIALYSETRGYADSTDEETVEIGILYELAEGTVRRIEVHTGHAGARASAGL
jgi:ketosteroid isomerase-like protein